MDEDLNIEYDYMKKEIRDLGLEDELTADLVEGVDICKDFTVSEIVKE